jgi:integrase
MSAEMGRPKTAWLDLPPRMSARKLASGKVLYYYQARGKKLPLGANLIEAKREWVRLETGGKSNAFPTVAKQYRDAVYADFAIGTKKHYELALRNLEIAFKEYTLEQIEPQDVKTYIRRRSKKVAAIFEKRVLSALYTWARGEGITSVPNPCAGVKFSKTERKGFGGGKRVRYVTDAEFAAVHANGDAILQDAMDLALVTGQRPGDILKAKRQDIRDGVLWVVQEKTGATVGIRVEDGLQRVIDRILSRKRPSMYLISDKRGQRVRYDTLNYKFTQARGDADWQFRDIRAKASTDSPTLKDAQLLLGHTDETTTNIYRRSKGTAVAPLKREV